MKFLAFMVVMLGTATLILYSGFTLPTEVALSILVLAIASDSLTTYLCLRAKGREGNPVMAFLFRRLGVKGTIGLWAVLWMPIIIFRFIPAVAGVQTAIALVYWLVPVNNLAVLIRLRRKARVS